MTNSKFLTKSMFSIVLSMFGFILVVCYSNLYVAIGLFLWTWGNNISNQLLSTDKASFKRIFNQ